MAIASGYAALAEIIEQSTDCDMVLVHENDLEFIDGAARTSQEPRASDTAGSVWWVLCRLDPMGPILIGWIRRAFT